MTNSNQSKSLALSETIQKEPTSKNYPEISKTPTSAEAYPAFNLPGSLNQPKTSYLSPYYQSAYDFPWNPDKLTQNNLYKIYDEMRDDDQIKACISFKKDIAISSGWKILCDNEDVREFIEINLKEKLEEYELGKSFEDILRDMLSAFEYGFSLTEPVYQVNQESLYEIKTLKVRPPHSFRFNIDSYGNILNIEQSTDKSDIQLQPQKFIHHVYQQEFGNPYGKSDLKAAHTAWAAKKFFTRFFGMYVERFASPPVVGKYNPNMERTEVTEFYNTLKSLQHSSTFVIPEDTVLEFPQPNRDSTDSYIKGLDMFNTWIARSILVPDLLGISGSKTSGGSYSLGETQYKLFLTTIEKERKNLERKITMRLVRPLVRINFGEMPCRFEFMPMTQDDEVEYSRLWSDFMKSRIIKPSEEEVNHFRRSLKYPEGPIELHEPISALMPNSGEKDEDEEGDQEPKEKEPAEKEQEMSLKIFRQMSPREQKFKFNEAKEALNLSEDRFLKKLQSSARAIISDYVNQIKDRKIISKFKPEAVNELQPRFLKDMNVEVKNAMKEMFKKFYEDARKEFFDGSKKVFTADDIMPKEFLDIIESDAFKSVGDYSIEVTKRAKNKLMQGIKNGLSEAELINIIKEEMGDVSDAWLQTFTRTKTTEMYNTARKNYFETDEIAKDIVEAYQWSSIMDERVSDVCAYLHGKIFKRGEFVNRLGPPAHFNCRSILLPVTKYEEYELDEEPSIDKIQSLGGNLIFSNNDRKFEMNLNNLSSVINLSSYKTTNVVEPIKRLRIEVKKIILSNADIKRPITVSIGNRMKVSLESSGTFSQDYGKNNTWILPINTPLTIQLFGTSSDNPNVDVTVEYIYLDSMGYRVGQ